MPNVRITDLDLMPFSSITSEDVFPIVDITDDVTYKIELSQLTKYISNFSNRWYIESGETITVTTNTQSFIYGDLLIYGELFLEENSKLFVVNGNIELISGGTITGDGTTHIIELPEFDTYVTGSTYQIYDGVATFVKNDGTDFDLTGFTVSNFTFIPSGETVTVPKNTQKFVYGDIIIDGDLILEDGSQLLNLNGDIIVSGGTISGTGNIISVDLPEIDTKVTGFTYNNNEFTILNNFGTSYSVTLDEMTGLTINGLLSANTINASTIDLCATNGTLFTDTISGCSPINVLSFTNFHEGLSGVTISGGTFYGDGSNLSGITTLDLLITGGTYSAGTATFTNNTGGTFDVTGFYTGGTDVFVTGGTYTNGDITFTNNTGGTFNVTGFYTGGTSGVSGDYLPLSGGTVTGDTIFTQSISANTIDGNILLTEASVSDSNNGIILRVGTGTTIQGYVYYLNNTNGWTLTNASATTESNGLLAIAVGTNPSSDGMLIKGTSYSTSFTGTTGLPLYLTTNDGLISTTAPSGIGKIVRIVGYKLNNTGSILFSPDPTWVQLS